MVLADVRSADYRAEVPDGCELSVNPPSGGWLADATQNVRAVDGTVVHAIGGTASITATVPARSWANGKGISYRRSMTIRARSAPGLERFRH
jgi:hypothetical protein